MLSFFYSFLLLFFSLSIFAQQTQNYQNHWVISGDQQILWDLNKDQNLPHQDNIELSGKRVSAIVTYAIDTAGLLSVSRQVFFPQLRTLLKTTDPRWYVYRAYFKETYEEEI